MENTETSQGTKRLNLAAWLVCAALLLPILTQAGRWIPDGFSPALRIFCGFLITQLPILLAILLAFLLTRTPIREIPDALGFQKLTKADLKKLAIHVVPVFLIVTLVSSGFSELAKKLGYGEPTQEIVELLVHGSWETFFTITFSAILLAPLVEEIAFRHILYRWTSGFLPQISAIAGVSLFFGAIHLTPWQIPALTLLAVIFQLEYIKNGKNTSFTILLHAGFNSITVLAALVMRIYHIFMGA